MKNNTSSPNNFQEERAHSIPDVEIIDLENDPNAGFVGSDSNDENLSEETAMDSDMDSFRDSSRPSQKSKLPARILSHINIHVILLLVMISFVAGIIYKVMTWGVRVDPDEIVPGEYDNSNDNFLPLTDAKGHTLRTDYSGDIKILAFGNAPFADDRGSENNLASIIEQMTGATVYNCAISGSYLAAELPYLQEDICPMDAFNFYWMCFLAMGNEDIAEKYLNALRVLGDDAPPEAREVYDILTEIDLNTIDVITLMYDGSDYLAGHEMYSDENAEDIHQFTGNMEAGLTMLQHDYPNIRIIVLSPTYAYGLDENGNYVSSDIQRYGWDVLSTYVIKQAYSANNHSVSFVDNLYGTIHEDNASEYLIDHIHLNVEGRKKVAERFVSALYHYNDSK